MQFGRSTEQELARQPEKYTAWFKIAFQNAGISCCPYRKTGHFYLTELMLNRINKHQAATSRLFFHAIGLFGILFFNRIFISTTPLNHPAQLPVAGLDTAGPELRFYLFSSFFCRRHCCAQKSSRVNTGRPLWRSYIWLFTVARRWRGATGDRR